MTIQIATPRYRHAHSHRPDTWAMLICSAIMLVGCSGPPDAGEPDAGQPDAGIGRPRFATLTVRRDGAATGAISAAGLLPGCADACTVTVPVDTPVTLVARPDPGAVFGGWRGGCTASDTTCRVTVTADLAVTAEFDVATFPLVVGLTGSGAGVITSTPGDITCPAACATAIPYNTKLELVAKPSPGATFVGWGGACTGTGACSITVTADTRVTAAFAVNLELGVTRAGNGTGTVASSPEGISCGAECAHSFAPDTLVTLTATATSDSTFDGWSGACAGTDACQVTMTAAAATSVTATFALRRHVLAVTRAGAGTGAITSSPAGIACGTDCSAAYDAHTQVTLTPSPATDSVFSGWSGGGCAGTGTCVVTMDAAVSVTATFALRRFTLTVTSTGTGSGTVTSSPSGIACGTDCSEAYDTGTAVGLVAIPAPGSTFVGWAGVCTGTGACQVTMARDASVTAAFAANLDLRITRAGNGTGAVSSTPAGISCGTDCAHSFAPGTVVTLTATPTSDSTFAGWGGACSGTTTCQVTMATTTLVTATFALRRFTLAVTRTGTGTGAITSSPSGISCGADCAESYDAHTQITLTPSPAADSVFSGWSGGCTGSGTCQVTMDAASSVTATFTLRRFTLTVTRTGTGAGTITSSPSGISCGTECSEAYDAGTRVQLTATPSPGSTFVGWGGACTGTGACSITLTADTSVTAAFAANLELRVTRTGNGAGTVSSTPAGVSCGTDCTHSFAPGTLVTLTASPASDATFDGWSGACTGTGTCQVTMDAAVAVTATFTLRRFTLTVTSTRTGTATGTITSSPSGISCGTDCTESFDAHTQVILTPSPATDSVFSGWSGGCAGTGTCQVTMDAAVSVTASFTVRRFTLTVARTGTGTITSTAAGISCGTDCSEAYDTGTVVGLIATPAPGSTFVGWGGACTGTDVCQVTMTRDTSVTATFSTDTLLAVTSFNTASIEVVLAKGSGSATPVRMISGTRTTLVAPRGLTVVNNEIIVADETAKAIDVFAADAQGDVVPVRSIVGPATQLAAPVSVAVFNNEIYVAQKDAILVFPLGARGNIGPRRIITRAGDLQSLFVANDEIYATSADKGISVFDTTVSGPALPKRTITGPRTELDGPGGILAIGNLLWVADSNKDQISIFPLVANGDIPPVQRIAGSNTGLDSPDQMAVFGSDIYVTNANGSAVSVFAINGFGDVAPSRTIRGFDALAGMAAF